MPCSKDLSGWETKKFSGEQLARIHSNFGPKLEEETLGLDMDIVKRLFKSHTNRAGPGR